MLSQGETHDAAVNFDRYQIFYTGIVLFLSYSTSFMYIQRSFKCCMEWWHRVRWFSRPWRKITLIDKSGHTTGKSHNDRKYVII